NTPATANFDPTATTVIVNGTTPSGNDITITTRNMVHQAPTTTTAIINPATTTTTWRTTSTASLPSPTGCEPSSGPRPSSRSALRSSMANPTPRRGCVPTPSPFGLRTATTR